MALSLQLAVAKETPPAPVEISSFSGAYLAGRSAEIDNDLSGAVTYYARALSFDPENQQLQQSLMLGLVSQGRFDEALVYAEKLKTTPDVERFSRVALAVDTFRKKDYEKAKYWLKLAVSSDLDKLITGLMTGWAEAGQGHTKEALEHLDTLQGPEWYTVFVAYHRALIAEGAGMTEEAAKSYEISIRDLSAGSAAPETWLRAAESYARFLARDGKKQEALKVLDRSEEFSVGRPAVAELRGEIENGQPIAALVEGPTQGASEIFLNLGTALNRGGGEAFVRLYLQFALALMPDSDVVLMQLAAISEQQQDAEQAIDLYGRIKPESSLKRIAELQRGLNLADLKRHDEAIAQLTTLIEAAPDDMRGYLALGGVYASKEDFESAAELYDRAVTRIPAPTAEDWSVFYQRGIAYERLKQWSRAEPNFLKALELFPDQPQVMNYLGYSWVDMNTKLEEGLELIKKAVEARPSDGYIVDSLGWAHYRLGNYEEAVGELERAVSLKPDDAVLNDHLGDAYWRAGRQLEATFQWAHARDMKPDADVLASVQKKLKEGLPALDPKAAGKVLPDTPADTKEALPEKKSELVVPEAPQVVTAVTASYTVQRGQSLWSIAAAQLGDGNRYTEILDLNPQLEGNPGRLVPGQELKLPAGN
ncbi:tetratricopeptide repeat protein [Mesorhizobium sp. NBSH29]|nr:tetratricopeptide repeat protein [Mesorhizobium sp. NBSH29]